MLKLFTGEDINIIENEIPDLVKDAIRGNEKLCMCLAVIYMGDSSFGPDFYDFGKMKFWTNRCLSLHTSKGDLYYAECLSRWAKVRRKNRIYDSDVLSDLQKANEKSLLKCANNVGLGGLAISLAKIFAHSSVGCELDANFKDEALLFSESASRAVVALKDEEEFLKLCADLDIKATFLGQSVDKNTFKLDSIELPLNELKKVYFESFRKLL